jgi:hypothetical protein
MSKNTKPYSVTIAANSQTSMPVKGDSIRIQSITTGATVTVTTNNEDKLSGLTTSNKHSFAEEYTSLIFENETGSPIVVIALLGYGDFIDGETRLSGEIDVSKNSNLSSLEDVTTTAAVITLIAPANTSREYITIIADSGNSDVVRVADAVNVSLTRGAPLVAGQNISLKTTAAVYAYSTLAQTVAMVET